jgi:hypothetical protein
MDLWPKAAIYFLEDDTFVVVFAFVQLRECLRVVGAPRVLRRQSPGHSPCSSFSRGAHEAGACLAGPSGIHSVFKSLAVETAVGT